MPHVSHYSRGVMVNAEKQEDFRGEKRSVMGELESRLSRSSIRDDKGCFPPPPPVFQTYAAQLAGKEQDQDMVESNTNKNMVESNTNKNMMESNTNKKTGDTNLKLTAITYHVCLSRQLALPNQGVEGVHQQQHICRR